MIGGKRQKPQGQFVGEFLLVLKKREMARVFEPDEVFLRSLDGLEEFLNQRWEAVRVAPSFEEEDWNAVIWAELT